jgi:UDP-glucuronate decarboxylase
MDFPIGSDQDITPTAAMTSFPDILLPPRRVLVTGGAGFIGSHLCERLLESDCEVLCVDNFFTGARRNIEHLLDHPRFEILRHDITFPLHVEVDEIYNLACPASPVHYQWDPVQTTKTSVLGAINMLGLAKRLRGRILQASTSEVYGDPEVHPQQESYWGHVNPIGPRSCYDEGKRCAETLFFDYGRQHKLKIKVLRIFNTYGPRMQPNDGRVVSNFIVQALNNQPITIYGDGQQTRSFCFVDDLVGGMIGLMNTPDNITGPMNCGNPNEFTIRDLAEKVIAITGSRSRIVHRPLPQDDPRQRRPDISQAQELLNWRPTVMLTEGLQRTISYFEKLQSKKGGRARQSQSIARQRSPSRAKMRELARNRDAASQGTVPASTSSYGLNAGQR